MGSSLALKLKARHGGCRFIALDSLKRRGARFNLAQLRSNYSPPAGPPASDLEGSRGRTLIVELLTITRRSAARH